MLLSLVFQTVLPKSLDSLSGATLKLAQLGLEFLASLAVASRERRQMRKKLGRLICVRVSVMHLSDSYKHSRILLTLNTSEPVSDEFLNRFVEIVFLVDAALLSACFLALLLLLHLGQLLAVGRLGHLREGRHG